MRGDDVRQATESPEGAKQALTPTLLSQQVSSLGANHTSTSVTKAHYLVGAGLWGGPEGPRPEPWALVVEAAV